MEEQDLSKITVGGSNPSQGVGNGQTQTIMQNLSLAMKMATLSEENPLAAEALRMLNAAETSDQVLAVLNWIDSTSSEES